MPDYFFEIPASSTGKYHPQYALGKGGLYRHTRALLRVLNHLLTVDCIKEKFSPRERDLLRLAGLIHDSRKSGEAEAKSKFTKFNHPLLAAEAVRQFKGKFPSISDEEIEYVASAVASHMGQWNTARGDKTVLPTPKTDGEIIVHIADYLASRKDIEIDVGGQEQLTPKDVTMSFGKYRGQNLETVMKEHPDYIEWLKNNVVLQGDLKTLLS